MQYIHRLSFQINSKVAQHWRKHKVPPYPSCYTLWILKSRKRELLYNSYIIVKLSVWKSEHLVYVDQSWDRPMITALLKINTYDFNLRIFPVCYWISSLFFLYLYKLISLKYVYTRNGSLIFNDESLESLSRPGIFFREKLPLFREGGFLTFLTCYTS